MGTYLVYHVDKGLAVIPREVSNHLNLNVVREDRCDQRDALICGESTAGQPFPGWKFTACEETVKSTSP